MDLTNDRGAVSNEGTGPNDGLDGSANESPKVDLTGSSLGDNSNITPTQELFSPSRKVVNYLTGDEAEKAWQGSTPNITTKPSSNGVLNGSDEVIEKRKIVILVGRRRTHMMSTRASHWAVQRVLWRPPSLFQPRRV